MQAWGLWCCPILTSDALETPFKIIETINGQRTGDIPSVSAPNMRGTLMNFPFSNREYGKSSRKSPSIHGVQYHNGPADRPGNAREISAD
jgi:hypothetical protein